MMAIGLLGRSKHPYLYSRTGEVTSEELVFHTSASKHKRKIRECGIYK
jgi:hypothetical protein